MKNKIVLAVLTTLILSPQAIAQEAADTLPGGTKIKQTKEQRKERRRAVKNQMKANRPPEARYVRMADKLPSLTADQKTKIESIKGELNTKRQALREQLKGLRNEFKASKGSGSEAMDSGSKQARKEKVQQLRQSMKALHEKSWAQISAILSEEQISELKNLKPTARKMKRKTES